MEKTTKNSISKDQNNSKTSKPKKDNRKNALESLNSYIKEMVDSGDTHGVSKKFLSLFRTVKRNEEMVLESGLSIIESSNKKDLKSEFVNTLMQVCRKKPFKGFLFWLDFLFKIENGCSLEEIYLIVKSAAMKGNAPFESALCGIVEISLFKQKGKSKYLKNAYKHLK